MSIQKAILDVSKEDQKGITIISPDGLEKHVSYKNFFYKSIVILSGIQKRGIKSGTEVIIYIHDIEKYLVAFSACILGKFIPVSVAVQKKENADISNALSNIEAITNDSIIITSSKDNIFSLNNFNNVRAVYEFEELIYISDNAVIVPQEEDELVMIQISSGTTGIPKGVMITNKNVNCCLEETMKRLNFGKEDTTLNWLPLTHIFALIINFLMPLYAKADQYHMMPATFTMNPFYGWM